MTNMKQKIFSNKLWWELGNWGFLLPHFFFFILFIIIPLISNIQISFYNWNLLGQKLLWVFRILCVFGQMIDFGLL